MSDLVRAIHGFAEMFDRLRIPYAIMGGWAVRLYGLPRPTYDIDFTITADRSRLGDLYEAVTKLGHIVPDQFLAGWVDHVADMPLVKFRLYVEGHGLDIDDVLLAKPDIDEAYMRRWAEPLGVAEKLEEVLAGRP